MQDTVSHGLDIAGEMMLEEYRSRLPLFERLRGIVLEKMGDMLRQSDVKLSTIESRIKEEDSLVGKLERKSSKYHTLKDITDILGVRVVAYYNEDVDRVASMAETLFDIDWVNSVDKRKMHQFDSFGYNSLHYICRLPKSLYEDLEVPELNVFPFELQMRTALQHVWSVIQHDIGYKTEIETPLEYHRSFSRLAGMLELADNEFSNIRNGISDYRRRMEGLVKRGKLTEVTLDGDTFRSYLSRRPFERLNRRIAAFNRAEILEAPLMPYFPVLISLGMKTLGDLERMLAEDGEDAYQLALYQLGRTDIDILSATIGLQNLCIVHILKAGGGHAGLRQMLDIVNGKSPRNDMLADVLMSHASRLSFMHP